MADATLHDFETRTLEGEARSLADFAGQVVLLVNVASKCGLTPHYEGLQQLYDRYRERGFSVLGFPCNQFGGQEPGSEPEIREFCTTRYGVTFPMFAKLEVNGAGRDPLYAWLTRQETAPDGAGDVAWNFAKFLVGRDGRLRARFAPPEDPTGDAIRQAVEAALES